MAGGAPFIAHRSAGRAHGDPSLLSSIRRGVFWKAFSQVVWQASRVIVALLLARLLTPEQYGLAGMVLVFASIVPLLADMALGTAVIQRPMITEQDRNTTFWMTVATGSVFTGLGVLSAGPIADFYHQPAVRPLFIALSLTFLITALGSTQNALLIREMDFRGVELRMMISTLVGAGAGLTVALLGGGAWALIVQFLVGAAAATGLVWVYCRWRPGLSMSFESFKKVGSYSSNVFGAHVFLQVDRNLDNLLVGRFIGSTALGAYSLAYNVMLLPFSRIAGPLQEVLFPALSRIQDDVPRLAAAWLRGTRIIAAVAMPCLLGLLILSQEFVDVVLGHKWDSATRVIQILTWVGILHSLQQLNPTLLQARDRTGTLVRYSLVEFVASATAFVLGLHWGIVGVATAYAIAITFVDPFYAWLSARTVGLSLVDMARALAGVFTASSAMAVVVLLGRFLLIHYGTPAAARLVALAVVGGIAYVPLCAWRAPELRSELRRLRSGSA